MVRGLVSSGGFGATLLSWFCSIPCVHMEACTGNGYLHPGQRQGWGPSDSIPSTCVYSCWQCRLCLSGEQHQHKRVWNRSPVQAGCVLGWSWQAGQSTRQFSICCLRAVTWSKQFSVSYSPPVNPTGFQTGSMGLSIGFLTPRLGCLICGSNLLIPREDPRACDIASSSGSPTRCVGPNQINSPLFLSDSVCIFLYSCDFRRAILLVFR